MAERQGPTGLAGGLFGILVFLVGVALLGLSFKIAYDMFQIPPAQMFEMQEGKPLDLGGVLPKLMSVVVRILLLLVMAVVGGMIANRGIRLYADARTRSPKTE